MSFLPLLCGRDAPVRSHAIHHSMTGRFALRRGDWVLIDSPTGGDNPEPDWFGAERGYVPHSEPGELYNLREDLSERVNRYREEPAVVEALRGLLDEAKAETGSAQAASDGEILTE